jgi:hypothetical protein
MVEYGFGGDSKSGFAKMSEEPLSPSAIECSNDCKALVAHHKKKFLEPNGCLTSYRRNSDYNWP